MVPVPSCTSVGGIPVTQLIAADKLGRRCIGAELDPTYCAHIIARYEADNDRI